jgi:hypothetical protein
MAGELDNSLVEKWVAKMVAEKAVYWVTLKAD